MSKQEWGTKRVCQSCGAHYYDLCKDPIICPKCDTVFKPPTAAPKRGPKPSPANDEPPKATPEEEKASLDKSNDEVEGIDDLEDENLLPDANDDVDDNDNDDDGSLIEDASDIGNDDDDMSEVREHIDDGREDAI